LGSGSPGGPNRTGGSRKDRGRRRSLCSREWRMALKELKLRVVPMTRDRMSALEQRGLIQGFLPGSREPAVAETGIQVDEVYATETRYGPHRLIRVAFDRSSVELAYHSDREDLLLINDGAPQKPLILVIALHPAEGFQRMVSEGRLSAEDIWALDLAFNDPRLSFFTMNAFTVHCEWTPPGPQGRNVFFVTEPRDLDMHAVPTGEYAIGITYTPGPG
jgi:hypothetical protein